MQKMLIMQLFPCMPFPTFSKKSALVPCLLLAIGLLPGRAARGAVKDRKSPPDLLVFSNGDRLTGKLEHEADGKVYFKSKYAGKLKVPWKNIKELRSQRPFAVIQKRALVKRRTSNYQVPVGTFTVENGTLTVHTSQEMEQMPVKSIAYLVDGPTFQRDVQHRQRIWRGFSGSVTAGVSTVNSTQNSESVNTDIALTRGVPAATWLPPEQRTLLNFSNTYGRITEPNIPTVKTNIFHAGLEEDEYFIPRFYLLQQTMFDHNFSQGLDLQQLYGVGVGYTAIKNPRQELDLNAAMNYTRQQFATAIVSIPGQPPTMTENLIGSTLGDTYSYKFPRKIVLSELTTYTPQWNVLQAYAANASAGVIVPVSKKFGFTAKIIESYLNRHANGFQGNSFQFNTGVTYTLP